MTSKTTLNGAFPNVWTRIPAHGNCPYSGLSRPVLYDLIRTGKIKSSCLKKPGAIRGIRLVWLPSVFAFIENHVDQRGDKTGGAV